jgi:NADH:ubiquinone oxidoreductase subunit 6 (subunit J)
MAPITPIISWAFAAIAFGAALVATILPDMRRASLALWVVGLGVGAVYLTVGAELLAVIQWILSTVIAVSLVFFSVMFGEYGAKREKPDKRAIGRIAMGGALAALLVVALALGLGGALQSSPLETPLTSPNVPASDLAAVGKALAERHFLSLEILALTLFLVLVGGGVLARPDRAQEGKVSR